MLGEVLYEFQQKGNSMKVSALDPKTRTEVSIVTPNNYEYDTMKLWARRKLERVVRKKMWARNKRKETKGTNFYA